MGKVICCLALALASTTAAIITFTPSDDVYILTFGGGEGWNTFMKFNISSLAAGNTIDSVYLTVYAYSIVGNWDGDANFWNVNDQAWNEATSANTLWVRPTSDLTSQASGFCAAVGWTRSVDLKQIFLTDYDAGHVFCSIKIKDPDETTFNPPPNSWPYDRDDTLGLGNRAFGFNAFFYPHEYANGCPVLFVYYTPGGAVEELSKVKPGNAGLEAYPNPFSRNLTVKFQSATQYGVPNPNPPRSMADQSSMGIYDATGRLVRSFENLPITQSHNCTITWDGTDDKGELIKPGIYFICQHGQRLKVIRL